MSEHAVLAPSSAHRWVHCPGSVALVRRYPQPESAEAAEGTAAHWAMAEMLAGRVVAEGQITDRGAVLTEEMIESAQVCVDDVAKVLAGQQLSMYAVEHRVSMAKRIHRDNWGTYDVGAYAAATRMIWVWDFKHGHQFVDEYENWQLIDYVAGIAGELGLDGLAEQHTTVVMTVVQPRCYDRGGPVRRWTVKLSDLRAHFNHLEMAADEATGDFPATTKPGPYCTQCDARHACLALQRDSYRSASLALQATPVDLPPEAAALELRMLEDAHKRLGARAEGLRVQIESTLRRGVPVAGWALEQNVPREAYTVPVEQVLQMASLMGINAAKAGAITPAQLRKAGMPSEVVAQISHRPPGVMKLARDDNAATRRIFDGFVK